LIGNQPSKSRNAIATSKTASERFARFRLQRDGHILFESGSTLPELLDGRSAHLHLTGSRNHIALAGVPQAPARALLPLVAPGLQWTKLDDSGYKMAGTFAVARVTGLSWVLLDYQVVRHPDSNWGPTDYKPVSRNISQPASTLSDSNHADSVRLPFASCCRLSRRTVPRLSLPPQRRMTPELR
jgi:hypothetical protein